MAGRDLYEVTGIQFMDANTLYQVLADRILEPGLTACTATRLMIADYFLHRFGGRVIAERTIASTCGCCRSVSGRGARQARPPATAT